MTIPWFWSVKTLEDYKFSTFFHVEWTPWKIMLDFSSFIIFFNYMHPNWFVRFFCVLSSIMPSNGDKFRLSLFRDNWIPGRSRGKEPRHTRDERFRDARSDVRVFNDASWRANQLHRALWGPLFYIVWLTDDVARILRRRRARPLEGRPVYARWTGPRRSRAPGFNVISHPPPGCSTHTHVCTHILPNDQTNNGREIM